MKFSTEDIQELRNILTVCKTIGLDGVVIQNGMALGVLPSMIAAIVSETTLSIPKDHRLGIGRVGELEKRLSIFASEFVVEGTFKETDMSLLTIGAGRTKIQFRCTSPNMMKYPKGKSDNDEAVLKIKFLKPEILQLVRAVKTLGAEKVVMQVSRSGTVRFECADSSNDKFEIELSAPAKYLGEEDSHVQTYFAAYLTDVLDAASKEAEEVEVVFGEIGSLTAKLKGHTVLLFPQFTDGDEEDDN